MVFLLGGLQAYSQNLQITNIDLENYSNHNFEISSNNNLQLSIAGDTQTFKYQKKSSPLNPSIVSTEKYKGSNSIKYTLPGTTDSNDKSGEKSQHRIIQNFPFEKDAFFGFAIKFDSGMLHPKDGKEVQFFQLWQGNENQEHPPLALQITSGGSGNVFNYTLEWRSNKTSTGHGEPDGFFQDTLQSGKWYTFVLKTKMHFGTKNWSDIVLWKNNVPLFQTFAHTGYDDSGKKNFDVFFGPYREISTDQVTVYYDEIKYGTSYASASPDVNSVDGKAQNVLFIGNSYTHRMDEEGNNLLPEMLASMAASQGDQLLYDFRTQNSHSLEEFARTSDDLENFEENARSAIELGSWDAVVLQEKSEIPGCANQEVQETFQNSAKKLIKAIREANSSTRPIMYQTWARQDGARENCEDPSSQHIDFTNLDYTISASIRGVALGNQAEMAIVGEVRRAIRRLDPSIQFYLDDNKHATLAGTYVAACTFYATIFKKDPALLTYNGGLDLNTATTIRQTASKIAFLGPKAAINSCNFGTPMAIPENNIITNFSKYFPLGEGAPTGLSKLIISYVYAQNRIDNFLMTINNVQRDLKPYISYDLKSNAASITITNSPFTLLNGKYYVKTTPEAFILVSATRNFTLYFTNSNGPVYCALARLGDTQSEESMAEIALSPNPAKDVVTLISAGSFSDCNVQVYNTTGLLYLTPYSVNGNTITLHVGGLNNGIYYVKISSGQTQTVKKMQVEN